MTSRNITKDKLETRVLTLDNSEGINKVLELERQAFNQGAMTLWAIAPFIISQTILINLINDEICSYGIFLFDKDPERLFFFSFAMDKRYRGKGLGKYFFKEVIDYMFKEYPRIQNISLTVDETKPQNVEMFKKIGFKEKERFKDFYGKGIDRLQMTLNKKDFAIESYDQLS